MRQERKIVQIIMVLIRKKLIGTLNICQRLKDK